MFLFTAVKVFEITLWFLFLSLFKLILFSFFERVIRLLVHYIGIPFLPVGKVTYSFAWFLLSVFETFEAIIETDCQIYYLIEIFRVCDHCHRALNL
jgi:hypothetical protein